MEINFGEICRTCLNKSTNFKSINEPTAHSLTYAQMIQYCTSIQVEDGDLLPSNICKACAKLLVISYKFKKQTEDVNKVLKSHLQEQIKCFQQTVVDAVPNEDVIIIDDPSDSDIDMCVSVDAGLLRVDEHEEVKCDDGKEGEKGVLKQPKKGFVCELCDKHFEYSQTLKAHRRSHVSSTAQLEKYKYECPTCCTSFLRKAHLERHMKIHTGVKEHECRFCKRWFTTKAKLAKHQKQWCLKGTTKKKKQKCKMLT